MTETKNWTQYEDKILKLIRDQQGVQKWSTIAQKMAQQFGIKGRNGKQCKQRYMEVFDKNNEVLHWDYQTQQLMFVLHDKIGNKWASIGQHLQNRSDNDIKNHFYSKIRKGLRKINYVIKDYFKKQFKEIKQTVLYKIIQGTQDRFSPNPTHEQDVWNFCTEVKNLLLKMSYDEQEFNPWNNFKAHKQEIQDFIQNLTFFSKEFKRKPTKIHKKTQAQQNFKNTNQQTSHKILPILPALSSRYNSICDSEIQSSQLQQSQNQQSQKISVNLFQSAFLPSLKMSMQMPILSKKTQKVNPVIILKSSNQITEMLQQRSSTMSFENKKTISQRQERSIMQIPNQKENFSNTINNNHSLMMPSIPKLIHFSSRASNAMIDQDQEDNNSYNYSNNHQIPIHCTNGNPDSLIESQLLRQGLLQQDEQSKTFPQFILFNGNSSRNITSKGSNFSSYSIQQQQEHFFEQDSTLNMRIYTTGVGGKKTDYLNESIQKSDKLFKSLQRGEQLFQSLGSRGKKDLQMSIQKSGDFRSDIKMYNSLFQSVGR